MAIPLRPGYGEAESLPPAFLAEVVIDCQDPADWSEVAAGTPPGRLPPVLPRPDTTGWAVAEAVAADGWLGSFDQDGNRIDHPMGTDDREPGGP